MKEIYKFEKNLLGRLTLTFNPFQANVPFLYPLKTSENLWFSDVFRGCKGNIDLKWVISRKLQIIQTNTVKMGRETISYHGFQLQNLFVAGVKEFPFLSTIKNKTKIC